MEYLAGIGIGLVIITVVFEVTQWMVLGWYMKDDEIADHLSDERMSQLELNNYSTHLNMFYDPSGFGKFIAKTSFPSLGSWYIHGLGVIPRWSHWSKVLDDKRAELIKNNK